MIADFDSQHRHPGVWQVDIQKAGPVADELYDTIVSGNVRDDTAAAIAAMRAEIGGDADGEIDLVKLSMAVGVPPAPLPVTADDLADMRAQLGKPADE